MKESQVMQDIKAEEELEDELKAMSLDKIRAMISSPKIVTLPSGIKIKVRHLTPLDYLKEGITDIPNEFARFIFELHKGTLDLKEESNRSKKNWDLFEKFLVVTIEKGVIEPKMTFRFSKEKADTHLLYYELSNDDQTALINAISGK